MNMYEQMRSAYLVELSKGMPSITGETMELMCAALDRVSQRYEIREKEMALAVDTDPIPALVKTYIVVKKTEGLSNGTLQNYVLILRSFFSRCRKRPEEVTANDIRVFLYEYSMERKISDRTMDKYRQMICWFFGWAHSEEYIQRNPARTIKAIKHEIRERQALTHLEMEQLRGGCETLRDRAILELMYSTGCRVSELSGIKYSDVRWNEGTVHLFGKGRKHRTSYLNARATVALKAYMGTRRDDCDALIVTERAPYRQVSKETIEAVIRRICEKSGLGRKVTPHIIRHTTATIAVNAGMPIEDVSKLLGHASVNTTMIYAKPTAGKIKSEHIRCVV